MIPSLSLFVLRLLLRGGGLGLGGLLLVAPDHDDAQEGADDGGGEQDEDDGDADGPDARGEEVLEGVVRVDEGLAVVAVLATGCCYSRLPRVPGSLESSYFIYHEQSPEGVVEEDDRGCHEHGDAHEFVKLRTWE